MDNFYSGIPHIVLNDKFEIIEADEEVREAYPAYMANGFFKNLLSGYTLADFVQPVEIRVFPLNLNSTALVFMLSGNNVVCLPVNPSEYKFSSHQRAVDTIVREGVPSIMTCLSFISDNLEKRIIDFDKIYMSMDMMNSSLMRMYRSTTNMALTAQIMSGNYPPVQITDLTSVIENISNSVTQFIPYVDVNLDIEKNVLVDCNIDFMTNAITNLFSNSVMFREDDDVQISIKLHTQGDNVYFTYKDNSKGIQDEFLPHIFKPYFSRDPYNDGEEAPSTGLGLFIAKSAFSQAGGNLMVSSSFEEGGVIFTASMPFARGSGDTLNSSSLWLVRSRLSTVAVQLSDVVDIPYEKRD